MDNIQFSIATGTSRTDVQWINKATNWEQLKKRLQKAKITGESVREYREMTKAQKGRIKDVGGFVGGIIKNGRRKAENVTKRSLVTLDIDYGEPSTLDIIEDTLYGNAWCVYSTHSHTPDTVRLRLVIPLTRMVHPDEYVPIARRIAGDIGIDLFDDSTYEPCRLMYWPSVSRDGEFIFREGEGEPIDPDKVLASYDNWHDVSEWPVSKRIARLTVGHGAKQEDPTLKPGVIGAFCRAYTITDAIETFLPDVYKPTGHPDRWTYAGGTTEAGAIVYDDIFLYSHHGTDPCCEQLVNAFDMVRLHRYAGEDKDVDPDTPINRTPSFVAMERYARSEEKTAALIARERLADLSDDFAELADVVDMSWTKELQMDERKKNFLPTPFNFGLIVRNDPRLRGCAMRDLFRSRDVIVKDLPWRRKGVDPYWTNSDDNGLIDYVSHNYALVGKTALLDAQDLATSQCCFHPVRDYLDGLAWDGVPRLDTLLIDYLGAADTELVRAMTRKHFAAAVARVMTPGIKYDYILTLIGPEGIGKSSLIRELGGDWFDDSLTSIEGREAMEQVHGRWLIEIGELTNYKRSTNEAYKAFISKQEDCYRPAYGRKVEVYPRQCVFFATTNERAFLKGDTGNRRFWSVECGQDMASKDVWRGLVEERDQIWAEATQRWREHEPLYLNAELEHQARMLQEEHNELAADDRIGIIDNFLDRPVPDTWDTLTRQQRADTFRGGLQLDPGETGHLREKITAVEILTECLGERMDERTRYRTKEINQILRNNPRLRSLGREYNSAYGRQWTFRIIREK